MKLSFITCLLLTRCLAAQSADFEPLFDGKSLSGWEGNEKLFRVEQGSVVAGTLKKRIRHNEFLCTTKEYRDFELKLKAKLVGKGHNAGVQFRSQRVPNSSEVAGYQCDMGQHEGHNIWGALYDESRRRKFLAYGDQQRLRKVIEPDGWNDVVVRCQGRRIRIWVNGLQTVEYTEADADIPVSGVIGLQIHVGPPSEAWYKDIRIKEL